MKKGAGVKVAIIFSLLTVFLYFPSVGGDQDIWFHLAYGRHFVNNLTWTIDHYQFNWTPFSPSFVYVTWIGSSILYLIYSVFSQYGLFLVPYGILFLLILLFRRYLGSLDSTSILAILGVALVLNIKFLYIKPDLFSALLFGVVCFIYYCERESGNGCLFYLYPPLFLFWVNTHGGFIVGLFLILLFAAEGATLRFRLDYSIRLAASMMISFLIVQFNSEGMYYPISIVQDFFSPSMAQTKETIMEYMSMWGALSLHPTGLRIQIAAFTMLTMLVSFILLSILTRDFDLLSLFLVGFFFVLGMSIMRASLYFPIIWFFAFFSLYRKHPLRMPKLALNLASPILILFLFARISYFVVTDYDSLSWFGFNWNESYPMEEVEYLKKAHPPGNIWNDYLSGGYLLWGLYPEYKVFIDPRYGGWMRTTAPTAKEFGSPNGVDSYTRRFPFHTAFIGYHEGSMIRWLLAADWRIGYLGKNALILFDKSIIPQISKEALAVDVSPSRFSDVSNPSILRTLFLFYASLDSRFGREIEGFYGRNVRVTYARRGEDLAYMGKWIGAMEAKKLK